MHAASLNAAEGALATAAATARANRAEAMELETKVTAENAEAWRKSASASPELAAAREQAQRETTETASVTAAELDQRQEKWENVLREQLKRRVKLLVSKPQRRPLSFCYDGRATPEAHAYVGF